eukprot:CAMPEP_0170186030 /NCGR_PEP_ID=MMETSP0040_2-20121228/38136_1 /TAXON_ID=641309 /ORGANISM="Lotharella oceanica, Strain CCMP622" /LENGTH=44 /DNA_ID= /DNA_START= /DNA_END= /DNA_ORIENTATION=
MMTWTMAATTAAVFRFLRMSGGGRSSGLMALGRTTSVQQPMLAQ